MVNWLFFFWCFLFSWFSKPHPFFSWHLLPFVDLVDYCHSSWLDYFDAGPPALCSSSRNGSFCVCVFQYLWLTKQVSDTREASVCYCPFRPFEKFFKSLGEWIQAKTSLNNQIVTLVPCKFWLIKQWLHTTCIDFEPGIDLGGLWLLIFVLRVASLSHVGSCH